MQIRALEFGELKHGIPKSDGVRGPKAAHGNPAIPHYNIAIWDK